MSLANNFDFTGVATDWLNEQGLSLNERIALLTEIQGAMVHNPKMKQLLVYAAERAAAQRLDPVNTIALAMTYGAAIGVLLERYKNMKVLV